MTNLTRRRANPSGLLFLTNLILRKRRNWHQLRKLFSLTSAKNTGCTKINPSLKNRSRKWFFPLRSRKNWRGSSRSKDRRRRRRKGSRRRRGCRRRKLLRRRRNSKN